MNLNSSKWVSALHKASLGLNTFQNCVCLADLQGDGEYKLIICDFGTEKYQIKLKVFRAVQLIDENTLSDLPASLVSFYNDYAQPSKPSLAIACGSAILIYKNLKPFYKFIPPSLAVNNDEVEAWRHVEAGHIDTAQFHAVLVKLLLKFGILELTSRSQTFLSSSDDRESVLQQCFESKLVRESTITCMTTMKRSTAELTAIDCIIFGTEYGFVYVIETQAFTILTQCKIQGIPVFLYAAGIYEVDYRIFVSTRNAEIFSIKREMKVVHNAIITMKADIIGMVRVGKQLVVACNDGTISFYTAKGRRQSQIKLTKIIKGIDTFIYEPNQSVALLVALEKEIRIYSETTLVDQQKVDKSVSWIKFGHFGREEGALIIGTIDGGLIVKLFRRTAKFDGALGENSLPQTQHCKLNIPRRTRIYLDQATREREQARLMHQIFQRDLFMLRLATTKAFANLTQKSLNSILIKKNEAVEMTVDINGFGPIFRLCAKLSTSSQSPIQHLDLIFYYNQELYQFEDSLIALPKLVPGQTYSHHTTIYCLNPQQGISDDVRIVLINKNKVIVAVVISMPISEISILD
ncbi:unnamed protein product [Thelazia callipaeda]|uniref:BBS1 domain-containing protein n=1 Tax=Thelazia callipaeda TaxID=103827 RepID=A0A0N5CYY5_THECL|nr:unnamed protein product [Thelazia callipaeda]